LEEADISRDHQHIRRDVVNEVIDGFIPPMSVEEQWDIPGLERQLQSDFAIQLPVHQWLEEDDKLHEEAIRERIVESIQRPMTRRCVRRSGHAAYREADHAAGPGHLWKEHLATMDHLRQGIHLRAYAQKNPKQEYKREAFELFQAAKNTSSVTGR
jgi:preprotein translocase subunit SecA